MKNLRLIYFSGIVVQICSAYWLENFQTDFILNVTNSGIDGETLNEPYKWNLQVGDLAISSGTISGSLSTQLNDEMVPRYENILEYDDDIGKNLDYTNKTVSLWSKTVLEIGNDKKSYKELCEYHGMKPEEEKNFDYVHHRWNYYGVNWAAYLNHFENLGIIIAGLELPPKAKIGILEYDKTEALNKLLFGFPSIKIPTSSSAVFWALNGKNFGAEKLFHGPFTADHLKTMKGYGIDGGPVMICHENKKDVIIISPFSTRSFQKHVSFKPWYDYYSSPMEQSVRLKALDNETTLEFGMGESFRNMDEQQDTLEFSKELKMMSETIIVVSDQGASHAMEKFGKMVEVFGDLSNSDCTCDICKQERKNKIKSIMYPRYLGYSLGPGALFSFNTGKFENYESLLEDAAKKLISPESENTEIGSISYGQWWYQREKENFEEGTKRGISTWTELSEMTKDDCIEQNSGYCWGKDNSASIFYLSKFSRNSQFEDNREFPVNCEYGFQNDQMKTNEDYKIIQENGDRACLNKEYSPNLLTSPRLSYGISIFYDEEHSEDAIGQILKSKGESGRTEVNSNDAGCRHITFADLPDQYNSMCFFMQNMFTRTKHLQNTFQNLESAHVSRKILGPGVTLRDATPNIVLEAVNTKYLTGVQVNSNNFGIHFSSRIAHSLGLMPNIGPVHTHQMAKANYDPKFALAVATLSMGDVHIGDDLLLTNWQLLNMCCSLNGEVVRPEQPIGLSDAQYHQVHEDIEMDDEISWNTFSTLPINEEGEMEVIGNIFLSKKTTKDLIYETQFLKGTQDIVYTFVEEKCEPVINGNIVISPSETTKLTYATKSFKIQNKDVAFLGDSTKFVPLSKNRIDKLIIDTEGIRVDVYRHLFNGGSQNKFDKVNLAFCIDGEYISQAFELYETDDESGLNQFYLDVLTGHITCINCFKCKPCTCPESCGNSCAIPMDDDKDCVREYQLCQKVGDEYCLSYDACQGDKLFTNRDDECGVCISRRDCLGCPEDSEGECDCEACSNPQDGCLIPPDDICSDHYIRCADRCKYTQRCIPSLYVDLLTFSECPEDIFADQCTYIPSCGCEGETCTCKNGQYKCNLGELCGESYKECVGSCEIDDVIDCPEGQHLIYSEEYDLECSLEDCDPCEMPCECPEGCEGCNIGMECGESYIRCENDCIIDSKMYCPVNEELEEVHCGVECSPDKICEDCIVCECPNDLATCNLGEICGDTYYICENSCIVDGPLFCADDEKLIESNDMNLVCSRNHECPVDCEDPCVCPENCVSCNLGVVCGQFYSKCENNCISGTGFSCPDGEELDEDTCGVKCSPDKLCEHKCPDDSMGPCDCSMYECVGTECIIPVTSVPCSLVYNVCKDGCLYQNRCEMQDTYVNPDIDNCQVNDYICVNHLTTCNKEGFLIQKDGSFICNIGSLRINSGHYFAWIGGKRYENYKNMHMVLLSQRLVQDGIGLGIRNVFEVHYTAGDLAYTYGTFSVTYYKEEKVVIFEQNFDECVSPLMLKDDLVDFGRLENGFPSISVPKSSKANFYFLRGANFGRDYSFGRFQADSFDFNYEEVDGNNVNPPQQNCFECQCLDCDCFVNYERLQCNTNGPLILLSSDTDDGIIISSYKNHFKQHSQILKYNNHIDIEWGHTASFGQTKRHGFQTIIQYSSDGATELIAKWAARFTDSKPRFNRPIYLEYSFEPRSAHYPSTDNINPKANVEELLLVLNHQFKHENLPFRQIQYDNWWFDHREIDLNQPFYSYGTRDWSEVTAVTTGDQFQNGPLQNHWSTKNGLNDVHEETKLQYSLTNKYFAPTNIYQDECQCFNMDDPNWVYPITEQLWTDLCQSKHKQSKRFMLYDSTHTHDLLNNHPNLLGASPKTNETESYFDKMFSGINKSKIDIRLSESNVATVLENLKHQNLISVRVESRYKAHYNNENGLLSYISICLGLSPSRAQFSPSAGMDIQLAIRVYTYSNVALSFVLYDEWPVELVRKTCDENGQILQPSSPLRISDKLLREASGSKEFILKGTSKIKNVTQHMLLIQEAEDTNIVDELGLTNTKNMWKFVSVPYQTPSKLKAVDVVMGTKIVIIFDLLDNEVFKNIGIMGETNKFTPLSHQRTSSIEVTKRILKINFVKFEYFEDFEYNIWLADEFRVLNVGLYCKGEKYVEEINIIKTHSNDFDVRCTSCEVTCQCDSSCGNECYLAEACDQEIRTCTDGCLSKIEECPSGKLVKYNENDLCGNNFECGEPEECLEPCPPDSNGRCDCDILCPDLCLVLPDDMCQVSYEVCEHKCLYGNTCPESKYVDTEYNTCSTGNPCHNYEECECEPCSCSSSCDLETCGIGDLCGYEYSICKNGCVQNTVNCENGFHVWADPTDECKLDIRCSNGNECESCDQTCQCPVGCNECLIGEHCKYGITTCKANCVEYVNNCVAWQNQDEFIECGHGLVCDVLKQCDKTIIYKNRYNIDDAIDYNESYDWKEAIAELQRIICEKNHQFSPCYVQSRGALKSVGLPFFVDLNSDMSMSEVMDIYNYAFNTHDGDIFDANQHSITIDNICNADDDGCLTSSNVGLIVGLTFLGIILTMVAAYVVIAIFVMEKDWMWACTKCCTSDDESSEISFDNINNLFAKADNGRRTNEFTQELQMRLRKIRRLRRSPTPPLNSNHI